LPLSQAIRESTTRQQVESCCALLGRACSVPELLALLLPRVRDAGADACARADALLALAHVLRGSGAGDGGSAAEAAPIVLELLLDPEVGESDDKHLRASCLEAARQLIAACPPAVLAEHAPQLLVVALLSLASDRAGLVRQDATAAAAAEAEVAAMQAEEAEQLLRMLAGAVGATREGGGGGSGDGSVDRLLAQHREMVLRLVRLCAGLATPHEIVRRPHIPLDRKLLLSQFRFSHLCAPTNHKATLSPMRAPPTRSSGTAQLPWPQCATWRPSAARCCPPQWRVCCSRSLRRQCSIRHPVVRGYPLGAAVHSGMTTSA
jgi:hypothetical protein